jgi:hypothetical protein
MKVHNDLHRYIDVDLLGPEVHGFGAYSLEFVASIWFYAFLGLTVTPNIDERSR